jgi:hypothetical protein
MDVLTLPVAEKAPAEAVPALAPQFNAADLGAQLCAEIEAMLRHAFTVGLEVPSEVLLTMEASPEMPLATLAGLHAQLAKLVAPSMPGTLLLLQSDRARGVARAVLGPLINVRRLTVASMLCMAGFVLISLSPMIDHDALAADIYRMHGLRLLTILCFLLSSAGLGSTFHALFMAQEYVCSATYDPRYDASYWIRIGLGLMAGLLLAVLVPVGSGADAPTAAKPVLALLGGFSAGLVHRILQRLVDTVESLFKGAA